MEDMTKRIITACHLDAGAVDEYGTEGKVVFESSEHEWNLVKNWDDWDFPKAELADILRGDLSDGVKVDAHFKDSDGDDRYGEVSGLDLAEARKYFGEQGTPMENLV